VNEDSIVGLIKTLSPHQRVVYPNTNSGYGQTDGTSQVTENDPVNPISCYGLTKCAAEKAVLEHPNSVCFRLATVFGVSPRMRLDLLVNDFTYKISHFDAKPFQLFEPHFKRNFVGVRDVSRAFMFMLGYDYTGVYNLGLPTANLSKIELAHRICHVLNVPKEAVYIGKGKDPDQRNYIVSNDKILSTGFKFRHELDDGIREVARLCPLLSPAEILSARNA
jgi:nucleoside-diphosphate-sugar epimerase